MGIEERIVGGLIRDEPKFRSIVSPSATASSWCGLSTECGRHEDAAEWGRRKGGRVSVVAPSGDRCEWVEPQFRLSEVSSFLAGEYGSGQW
jgi:hypothetical protein